MPAPNHYEVLGVMATATDEEISQRSTQLMEIYSSAEQVAMRSLIQEASRVLLNPALRSIYDSGLASESVSPPPPVPPGTPLERTVEMLPFTKGSERTTDMPVAHGPVGPIGPVSPITPITPPTPAIPDNRDLARELAKRGVDSKEVSRLLAGPMATTTKKGKVKPPAPDLTLPPSVAIEPKPKITLPDFREPSASDRMEAERLFAQAGLQRRRGQLVEASGTLRKIIEFTPSDAAALELYGDTLQEMGRVDDALYAYNRALEANPKRQSAEKKYAELMLLQNREVQMLLSVEDDNSGSNTKLAMILSAVFPGSGQMYSGQWGKGLFFAALMAACIYMLAWTPFGFSKGLHAITPSLMGLMAVTIVVYILSVVDAGRGRRGSTGWEV